MIQLITVHAEDEQIDLSEGTYENLQTKFYSCGDELIEKIPANVPKIINIVYLFIQVLIPIILIIMGMVTLLKAVSSSKEEDIKKAQMTFVKRLIIAALVFFTFVFVKLLVSITADSGLKSRIIDCTDCFLNGEKKCSKE